MLLTSIFSGGKAEAWIGRDASLSVSTNPGARIQIWPLAPPDCVSAEGDHRWEASTKAQRLWSFFVVESLWVIHFQIFPISQPSLSPNPLFQPLKVEIGLGS